MEKTPPTEETAAPAPKAPPSEWRVTAAIEYVDVYDADVEVYDHLCGIKSIVFTIQGPELEVRAYCDRAAHVPADAWMGLLEGRAVTFHGAHGLVAIHSRGPLRGPRRGPLLGPYRAEITFEVLLPSIGGLRVTVPREACRAAITTVAEAVAEAARAMEAARVMEAARAMEAARTAEAAWAVEVAK